jgi:hypothetical protein
MRVRKPIDICSMAGDWGWVDKRRAVDLRDSSVAVMSTAGYGKSHVRTGKAFSVRQPIFNRFE